MGAGASHDARPVATPRLIAKAISGKSTPIVSVPGRSDGRIELNTDEAIAPTRRPAMLPVSPKARPSVRSWRTILKLPAPIADRSAISLRRDNARDSSKLAIFAHAIRSTAATVDSSMSSRSRAFPTRSDCSEITVASLFQLRGIGHGKSFQNPATTERTSARAQAIPAPGRNRANSGTNSPAQYLFRTAGALRGGIPKLTPRRRNPKHPDTTPGDGWDP